MYVFIYVRKYKKNLNIYHTLLNYTIYCEFPKYVYILTL